jgi:hypothetical protein
MLGSWRAMLELPDRYAALGAQDVQRAAQRAFALHRRNVVTLLPGELPEPDPSDAEAAQAGGDA